jgi:hypothetical protein
MRAVLRQMDRGRRACPREGGVTSMSRTMRLGTTRNEPQYCSTSARPRRSNARRSQDGAELAVRFSSPPLRDRWFADSPLEGMDSNFQFRNASLPPTAAFISEMSGGSLDAPLQRYWFAEADECSDDTPRRLSNGPNRARPRKRWLPRAELKVRIHSPPAASLQTLGPSRHEEGSGRRLLPRHCSRHYRFVA